ncbi:F0F1 ATP synthase subunit A, partial [Rahnella sp. C60]|uniref:F0F1 ATP synthase subunit A n=1 Tax=Rahnella perminowiae TaxID=2816244 RepID=UPI001C26CD36
TPCELNRVMLIRLLGVFALVSWLWLGTRNMKLVPTRGQAALEYMLGFVRNTIVFDTLGEKDGKRFLPILMTFFFLIIGMNLTGIIPGLQIASTAVIGLPLILALVAYVMFVYAGFRKHSIGYLKNALVIPGVPWPQHIMLIQLEFLS